MATTLARDVGGTAEHPAGMHSLGLQQAGARLTVQDAHDVFMSATPTQRYCVAGWLGTVGCRARVWVSFHSADGKYLDGDQAVLVEDGNPGGADLSSWVRNYVFATAPAGTAWLRVSLRQIPVAGATAALVRMLRPTVEEALPGQTQPSLWAESSTGMRAAFRQAQDAVADELHAQATAIEQLKASAQASAASIERMERAYAAADTALGESVATVKAETEANAAEIGRIDRAYTTADAALAQSVATVKAETEANAAEIGRVDRAYTAADSALAQSIATVKAETEANAAEIGRIDKAYTTADAALTQSVATVKAETEANAAEIGRIDKAYTTADAALAQSVATVKARLDDGGDIHTALVQVESKATATAEALSGAWSVTIDVNGKTTGIQSTNDGKKSAFIVSADEVILDGSVSARKLSAEAISAVVVQAKQGVFDALYTKVISAINAAVETITAVRMELTAGSDWSFIRTASKWLGDGVSGFISAARAASGDYFQEFFCSSGAASILSRRSGGPNVGMRYRERVVDATGKELLDIAIEGGQTHARFGGEVVGVSGTFGEVTAGLMRNSDSSASVNLSAVGDQVFARWGGEDRIWANGRTRFSSLLISGNWANLGLVAAKVDRIGSVASGGYSYIKDVGGSVTIDTGIPMDSLPWNGGYEDCYFVTVSGFSIDSTLQSLLNSTGSRLCLSARVAYQMPTAAGETWGNVTLHVIVEASFCPAITLPDSTMRATVLSAVINVKRAS